MSTSPHGDGSSSSSATSPEPGKRPPSDATHGEHTDSARTVSNELLTSLPRLALPVRGPLRAPGLCHRTGAPRTVAAHPPAAAVIMLDEHGAEDTCPAAEAGDSASSSASATATATAPATATTTAASGSGITALRRGAFAVVCGVCERALPQYTCPKCGVPYCSLACYRAEAHGARCAEKFYEEQVRAEMAQQTRISPAESAAKAQQRAQTQQMLARVDADAQRARDEGYFPQLAPAPGQRAPASLKDSTAPTAAPRVLKPLPSPFAPNADIGTSDTAATTAPAAMIDADDDYDAAAAEAEEEEAAAAAAAAAAQHALSGPARRQQMLAQQAAARRAAAAAAAAEAANFAAGDNETDSDDESREDISAQIRDDASVIAHATALAAAKPAAQHMQDPDNACADGNDDDGDDPPSAPAPATGNSTLAETKTGTGTEAESVPALSLSPEAADRLLALARADALTLDALSSSERALFFTALRRGGDWALAAQAAAGVGARDWWAPAPPPVPTAAAAGVDAADGERVFVVAPHTQRNQRSQQQRQHQSASGPVRVFALPPLPPSLASVVAVAGPESDSDHDDGGDGNDGDAASPGAVETRKLREAQLAECERRVTAALPVYVPPPRRAWLARQLSLVMAAANGDKAGGSTASDTVVAAVVGAHLARLARLEDPPITTVGSGANRSESESGSGNQTQSNQVPDEVNDGGEEGELAPRAPAPPLPLVLPPRWAVLRGARLHVAPFALVPANARAAVAAAKHEHAVFLVLPPAATTSATAGTAAAAIAAPPAASPALALHVTELLLGYTLAARRWAGGDFAAAAPAEALALVAAVSSVARDALTPPAPAGSAASARASVSAFGTAAGAGAMLMAAADGFVRYSRQRGDRWGAASASPQSASEEQESSRSGRQHLDVAEGDSINNSGAPTGLAALLQMLQPPTGLDNDSDSDSPVATGGVLVGPAAAEATAGLWQAAQLLLNPLRVLRALVHLLQLCDAVAARVVASAPPAPVTTTTIATLSTTTDAAAAVTQDGLIARAGSAAATREMGLAARQAAAVAANARALQEALAEQVAESAAATAAAAAATGARRLSPAAAAALAGVGRLHAKLGFLLAAVRDHYVATEVANASASPAAAAGVQSDACCRCRSCAAAARLWATAGATSASSKNAERCPAFRCCEAAVTDATVSTEPVTDAEGGSVEDGLAVVADLTVGRTHVPPQYPARVARTTVPRCCRHRDDSATPAAAVAAAAGTGEAAGALLPALPAAVTALLLRAAAAEKAAADGMRAGPFSTPAAAPLLRAVAADALVGAAELALALWRVRTAREVAAMTGGHGAAEGMDGDEIWEAVFAATE